MANGLLLGRFFLITWIFRLLMFLDDLLLTLCRAAYKVFVYTSRITLINGEQIELFTNRVYLILGIALVFIIAYNLLTYIVDPDKISDKKSGAGAFVKNVIISLTIIVITPMAFVKLYSFQNTVITQGIIANIIMGAPSNDSEEESDLSNLTDSERAEALLDRGAKNVTATVYSSFIVPAGNGFSALDCYDNESDTQMDNESDTQLSQSLEKQILEEQKGEYCEAYQHMQETGSNSRFRTLIDDYEDEFDYYFIVSTAGVLVMLFFFASYCIELGKRAGKLAILQLLAPIPVAMEIVPGKSGSRQKWLNEVISTYLDVFIYQATVFIVIFLSQFVGPTIQNLFSTAYSGSTGVISVVERTFALVFLTFGLFKFGKDVPKMIEDLIGIKGAGSFGDVAKRAFAMAGVSGGLLGSTVGRFARNYNDTDGSGIKGFLKKTGSGLAGAGSGIVRTLWGAKNAHSIKDARNLRKQINGQLVAKKVQRSAYAHSHPGKFGSTVGHIQDTWENVAAKRRGYFGTQNTFEEKAEQEKVLSEMKSIYKAELESAIYSKDAAWNQLKSMKAQAEANGGSYVDSGGVTHTLSDIKTAITAKEQELRGKNVNQVARALGRMQNLASANQGITGISSTYHSIDDLFDAAGNYSDTRFKSFEKEFKGEFDEASRTVISHGFDSDLKALKIDQPYQKEKVAVDIAKEAKEQAEKAAKEKSAEKK